MTTPSNDSAFNQNQSSLLPDGVKNNILRDALRNFDSIIYPTMLWLLTLLTALITSAIFLHVIHGGIERSGGFHSWDGFLYLGIVNHGYVKLSSAARLPLLPLLILGMHYVTHISYTHCGFAIVNIAYWFALIFFYKLLLMHVNQVTARRALWLLAMFPTAIFFHALYADSLNLLLTILFFYCLQRDHWYAAMVCGFFAGISHTLGVLVAVAGLCYLLQRRQQYSSRVFLTRFLSLSIAGGGLLIYMIYLQVHFGDALAFIHAQKSWDRTSNIPIYNIFSQFYYFATDHQYGFTNYIFVNLINGLTTLWITTLALIMFIRYRKSNFITPELKVFFLLTLLFSISSGTHHGTLESYGRLMAVLFPAFMIWADQWRSQNAFNIALGIMIPLKTILQGMFVSGYWVT